MKFQPLLFDNWRCSPIHRASDKCITCARWADHDKQTFGPRTAVQDAIPDGDGCDFVPGYVEEKK